MTTNGGLRLEVGVVPNASSNKITGWQGETLKVKLMAPPENGRANKSLTEFLSHRLKLPRFSITLVRGEKSRRKIVEIVGVNIDDIKNRLNL